MAPPHKKAKSKRQAVVPLARNQVHAPTLNEYLPVISKLLENMFITDLIKKAPLLANSWKSLHGAACKAQTRLTILVYSNAEVCRHIMQSKSDMRLSATKLCTTAIRDPRTYVRLDSLSRTAVRNLVHLFPNITELVVMEELPVHSFSNLFYLLRHWSTTLVALHLEFPSYVGAYRNAKTHNFMQLFRAINRVTNLRRLKFDCSQIIFNYPDEMPGDFPFPPIDLPILSQLEFFQFSSYDAANVLLNSLQAYATSNPNLPTVDVDINQYLQWPAVVATQRQWLSTFIERFVKLYCEASEQTMCLVAKATNLEVLRIVCEPEFSLAQSLRLFARLPRLSLLKLELRNIIIESDQFMRDFNRLPRGLVPRLANLQMLVIDIHKPASHQVFKSSHLGVMFPKLAVLHVTLSLYECTKCGYRNPADIPKKKLANCARRVVKPFIDQCIGTLVEIIIFPDPDAKVVLSPEKAEELGVCIMDFAQLLGEITLEFEEA